MSQITLPGQVIQLLPRDSFKKLVCQYKTDKHGRGLSSWDHLASMLFFHLAGTGSVRDISNGLRSITGNRGHLGWLLSRARAAYRTSTGTATGSFSVTTTSRYFEHLILKRMPGQSALRNIKRKIFLMDTSVIPLCLSLFVWAAYRRRKGGLKLHTILDYDGLLPVFCHITDVKTHEVTVARQHTLSQGKCTGI